MYKTLCVAVLLFGTFVLTSGSKPADASPTRPSLPVIVATGKLVDQTAPIPTTTIFTSPQDGLVRVSFYATLTKADPNSHSYWSYNLTWTDDAGPQFEGPLLTSCGYTGQFNCTGIPNPLTIEAKTGTAVTYNMTQTGPPDSSSYSLYYTVERLQ